MDSKVVFFDKDGTLVVDVPYNVDPKKITLVAGAARALKRLADAGYHFVVVSNQSGVARGYFPEDALEDVSARVTELLEKEAGVRPEAFYYCPHHPDGSVSAYAVECNCRKPRPGMLMNAALDLEIDLAEAWMIGDILNDIEAGKRAGCRTILIDNGNETEWRSGPQRTPDFTAANLDEAAEIILEEAGRQPKKRSQEQIRREEEQTIDKFTGNAFYGGKRSRSRNE